MFNTNRTKGIPGIAFCLLLSSVISCSSPTPGSGTVAATVNVIVSNPEYMTPIGYPSTQNPTYSPGFELEITVNTLNSSNQATYYWSKVVTYSHADIISASRLDFTVKTNIPSSGSYVIEYKLRSLDCTWPQTAPTCTNFSSRKYFRDQHTFVSGNPGTYRFFATIQNKYTEMCC